MELETKLGYSLRKKKLIIIKKYRFTIAGTFSRKEYEVSSNAEDHGSKTKESFYPLVGTGK